MWFSDARYVDDEGRAIPVPEHGDPPSVDHLLATCIEPGLRSRARTLLKEHVDIDDHCRWRYAMPEGALRLRDDAFAERLQLAIARMYDNFLFNSRFVAAPERKNFDRGAAVSAFPVSMLPALRRCMQRQLALAVYEADAWLIKQQGVRRSGKVCDAGVGVYLFTGPPRPRSSTSGRARKKPANAAPQAGPEKAPAKSRLAPRGRVVRGRST
jgi:hypothetical protein